jgi:hypothetical protein
MVDILKPMAGAQRAEKLMGTIAEEWFEQGRQKGLDEGLERATRATHIAQVLEDLAQ